MSEKKFSFDLVRPEDYSNICNAILETRREDEDGTVEYDEVEFITGETCYIIKGYHFPVQDVINSASSSCKVCSSKGYITSNVPKTKLPDPSGFFVEDADPNLSPVEAEKASKFWRITTPCECGVKNVIRKNKGVFTIDTRCVFVDLTYTIKKIEIEKQKIEIVR